MQVEPPLSKLWIDAVLCASIKCPRFGIEAHFGGESPKVLSAQLSGYSATLDATSRISQTVDSALIQLTPEPAEPGTPGRGVPPVTLLQAPCGSLITLHQSPNTGHMEASALVANERVGAKSAPGRFLTLSYRPPGVVVMCFTCSTLPFANCSYYGKLVFVSFHALLQMLDSVAHEKMAPARSHLQFIDVSTRPCIVCIDSCSFLRMLRAAELHCQGSGCLKQTSVKVTVQVFPTCGYKWGGYLQVGWILTSGAL
jgi:hypothetical protein